MLKYFAEIDFVEQEFLIATPIFKRSFLVVADSFRAMPCSATHSPISAFCSSVNFMYGPLFDIYWS